jgi:23S rRNA (adenine1618-N6)-methyltransferase
VARADVPYKELLPFPTELSIRALRKTLAEACAEINKVMSTLDMAWFWKQDLHAGVAFAKENVWSRSARRRKQRQGEEDHDAMDEDERSDLDPEEAVALGVKISVSPEKILIRWIKGFDSVLFESFCGMLKRNIVSSARSSQSQSCDQNS